MALRPFALLALLLLTSPSCCATTNSTAAAAPGAPCASDAACGSASACRGGHCCHASAMRAGCSQCLPHTGSCVLSPPGEPCASAFDCGTHACSGGCCCAPSAMRLPGAAACTSCACWSNPLTTAATAGECEAEALPLPPPQVLLQVPLLQLQAAPRALEVSASPVPAPPALPPPFYSLPPYNFGDPTGFSPTLPTADRPASLPACVLLNSSSNVVPAPLAAKSSARATLAGVVGGSIVLVLIAVLVIVALFPNSCLGRWCQLTANCCPPLDCLPPLGGLELYLAIQRAPQSSDESGKEGHDSVREALVKVKEPLNACERRCVAISPELDESLGNETPSARGVACTLIIFALLAMYSAYSLTLWVDGNSSIVPGLVPYMAGLPFLNPPTPLASSIVGGMPGVSGVTLRFFIDGDPAQCAAPQSAVSSDDPPGQLVPIAPAGASTAQVLALAGTRWVQAPPQRCGGSARNLSQVTYFCPACAFTPTSSLTLTLHFSCQSILMEAVAVQAFPQNSLSFVRRAVSAQGNGSAPLPLSAIQWALPIIPTNVIDLLSDDPSKLWPVPLFVGPGNYSGYLFSASNSLALSTQGLTAAPLPVRLLVQLPQASYIYINTVSQLVVLMDQLGVIVGFFPSVFGMALTALVFLRMIIVFCKVLSKPPKKGGGKRPKLVGEGKGWGGEGGATSNLLLEGGSSGRGKSKSPKSKGSKV